MAQENCNSDKVAGGDLGGGGPFREMFVELSDAVFAALKGIGEEAVRKAQEPKPPSALTALSLLDADRMVALLCVRYGWQKAFTQRNACHRTLEFGVKLDCGHRHRFAIDEFALGLCANPALNVIDQLDAEHEHNPRSCYCTPRAQ